MVPREWPFNPNFPQPFLFPGFGTPQWLALAWWPECKGDPTGIRDTDKIRAGAKLDWPTVWFIIYKLHQPAAYRRFLNRICFGNANAARSLGVADWQGPPAPTSIISLPDTERYSLADPRKWVTTLLDANALWWYDINGWALECVQKEFRMLNPTGGHLAAYGIGSDADGAKAKQCELFSCRFYAYQQARYRYHEHLLEKHCERALGGTARGIPAGYKPSTPAEARASLIGWLSKQRGCAGNLAVQAFRRRVQAKKSPLTLGEKKAFFAEREHPSGHRYRISRSAPRHPDEMGWLILTWPVWNFYRWKWTHIAEALIRKFEFVDARGRPLDFLRASRKRLRNALRANLDRNDSMPADEALALFEKYLLNPTSREKAMHTTWDRIVRGRRDDKAVEQRCRLAVSWLPISDRPKGRGTNERPPLFDLVRVISV